LCSPLTFEQIQALTLGKLELPGVIHFKNRIRQDRYRIGAGFSLFRIFSAKLPTSMAEGSFDDLMSHKQ
jgi:hypothetical protein